MLIIILVKGFIKNIAKGNMSKMAISRSKIRNKIAIKKNRKEKGRREELMGAKPHS